MHIGVITPLFPTRREPYRGAAIWNTLRALTAHASVSAYCVHPYPKFGRRRSFRYHHEPVDAFQYGVPAQMVHYFAVPWATRCWNAHAIHRRLTPTLRAASLDLLLCYWIHPEGYAAVRLARALGIPVVLGTRGSDLAKPHRNPMLRNQIRLAMEQADAVLCVSQDLARRATALGAAGEKVLTIPNGVDRTVFDCHATDATRERLRIPAGCHLAVFVGWLSELKGISQLVQALGMLQQRDPGRWRLAVIGEGYLRGAIERQIARLGLNGQVFLLGPKRPAEVADWMKAADVLCLPSETEGCPNVVLEALSVGTPVLATAVGGVPDLVHDDCGILIQNRQPQEIAEGLRTITSRRWDRRAIARANGRGWDRVARETYDVCEWVMDQKKDGSGSACITK